MQGTRWVITLVSMHCLGCWAAGTERCPDPDRCACRNQALSAAFNTWWEKCQKPAIPVHDGNFSVPHFAEPEDTTVCSLAPHDHAHENAGATTNLLMLVPP